MKRMIIASKVTDYIDPETLHSWMQNPNFGEFTSYRQLPGMMVETLNVVYDSFQGAENATRKRYWKFSKSADGWEVYEVDRSGKMVRDAKLFTVGQSSN